MPAKTLTTSGVVTSSSSSTTPVSAGVRVKWNPLLELEGGGGAGVVVFAAVYVLVWFGVWDPSGVLGFVR